MVGHEPDDPVVYGEKVAELVVPTGWVSPNYVYGQHWSRARKMKKAIDQAVMNHMLQLSPEERSKAKLNEPRPRVLKLTFHQSRQGRLPDIDNVYGGFKYLIDALKRVRYRFTNRGLTKHLSKAEAHLNGPGLIWDDDPRFLRIAEIYVLKMKRGAKESYVEVEVFEWPEEE